MLTDVKILTQAEKMKPNDAGRYRAVIETTFMVGADGPFYVAQEEDGFDPARQTMLIEQKANAVRTLRASVTG